MDDDLILKTLDRLIDEAVEAAHRTTYEDADIYSFFKPSKTLPVLLAELRKLRDNVEALRDYTKTQVGAGIWFSEGGLILEYCRSHPADGDVRAFLSRLRRREEEKQSEWRVEAETRRPLRAKKGKIKCPHGHTFGHDADEFDECGPCKLWDNCMEERERLEALTH